MCLIGHGAWGIITKQVWCNYFAVFGIGQELAYTLMPWLGSFDILLGIALLLYPFRVIPAWLAVWAFITALLRPLSGEPFAEFIERAGNFGAPLALLLVSGGLKNIRQPFSLLQTAASLDRNTWLRLRTCLTIVVFLLLLGHGWLNLMEKKGLIDQYASLGFTDPHQVAHIVGLFEILGSLTILIRPLAPLILILFIWKMGSELFYPHHELFEWIERGGSYGCLLALWFTIQPSGIHDNADTGGNRNFFSGIVKRSGRSLNTLSFFRKTSIKLPQ